MTARTQEEWDDLSRRSAEMTEGERWLGRCCAWWPLWLFVFALLLVKLSQEIGHE